MVKNTVKDLPLRKIMENRPVANARTDVAKASRIGINKGGLLKKVSPPSRLKIAIIAKNSPSISADVTRNQNDHLLKVFLGKIEKFKLSPPHTYCYNLSITLLN